MDQSPDISALTKALVAAKAEFRPLTPDKVNPHFHSKYASLNQCYEVTDAALLKHGLIVTQWLEPGPDGLMALTTQIQHESGQWQRSTGYLPFGQPSPQAAGSAITYARRYGLAPALGIAPDEDDDANQAQVAAPQQQRQPQQRSAPQQGEDMNPEIVLSFGKYKGQNLSQIYAIMETGQDGQPKKAGASYLHWLAENANNANVKASAVAFLERKKAEREAPKPAPVPTATDEQLAQEFDGSWPNDDDNSIPF